MSNADVNYMKRALQLAQKGAVTVSPNPMVGALIVKNNKIIAEGYHKKKGGPHAEVEAINSAKESVEGSTLYCTLEPCCHTNKMTPPCVDLLIEKKIGRVVIATLDPNPSVSGKGKEKLSEAGIEVVSDVLGKEAQEQNRIFFKNMRDELPYLKIKTAITLDGRMCSQSGDSKWISSEYSRNEVHQDRARYDAIMIGVNTLRNDNPLLNSRKGDEVIKENKKIIVGTLTNEDLALNLFSSKAQIINIHTGASIEHERIISLKMEKNWKETLSLLFEKGINSIYAEGGSKLITSLIEQEVYDEMTFYVSPKLIGNGPSLFESQFTLNMEDAKKLNGVWKTLPSGEVSLEVRR